MPTIDYATANGMILGEQTATGPQIDYVPDALGSIIAAIDQNSNTTYTAAYKPYGSVLASTGTSPYFTFVGMQGYLAAAGRPYAEHSVRARFYSETTARWASVDPIWPNLQAYTYADQSPARFVDPNGQRCTSSPPNITVAGFIVDPIPVIGVPTLVAKSNTKSWNITAYLDTFYWCELNVSPCWADGCIPHDCNRVRMPQWIATASNLVAASPWGPDNEGGHVQPSASCGCPVYSACYTTQQGEDCPGWNQCKGETSATPLISCDFNNGPYTVQESEMCQGGQVGIYCQWKVWFRSCCNEPWPIGPQPPSTCGNKAPVEWGYMSSFVVRTPGKHICVCFSPTDGNLSDFATPCSDFVVCS